MKRIASCLIFVVLAACQTGPYSALSAEADTPLLTEERRKYMLAELEVQRALWSRNTPQKYIYQTKNGCFCFPFPATGPNQIRVENGRVVSRVYLGKTEDGFITGQEIEPGSRFTYSIEDLFEIIDGHLKPQSEDSFYQDSKINFTVEYDAILGFPKEIFFDAEQVLDEQYTLNVEQFTVIE